MNDGMRIANGATVVNGLGLQCRVTSHVLETKHCNRCYRVRIIEGPGAGRLRLLLAEKIEAWNPDAPRVPIEEPSR